MELQGCLEGVYIAVDCGSRSIPSATSHPSTYCNCLPEWRQPCLL